MHISRFVHCIRRWPNRGEQHSRLLCFRWNGRLYLDYRSKMKCTRARETRIRYWTKRSALLADDELAEKNLNKGVNYEQSYVDLNESDWITADNFGDEGMEETFVAKILDIQSTSFADDNMITSRTEKSLNFSSWHVATYTKAIMLVVTRARIWTTLHLPSFSLVEISRGCSAYSCTLWGGCTLFERSECSLWSFLLEERMLLIELPPELLPANMSFG